MNEYAIGYLFTNPDTGTEFSRDHPIDSGECPDAEDVCPATAEALLEELKYAWGDHAESLAEIERLRWDLTTINSIVTSPYTVYTGMRRGRIAKPSFVLIRHAYEGALPNGEAGQQTNEPSLNAAYEVVAGIAGEVARNLRDNLWKERHQVADGFEDSNRQLWTAFARLKLAAKQIRALRADHSDTAPSAMPWQRAELAGWSIVGMNHYHQGGQKHLFVSMVRNGRCITAEGTDATRVWDDLATKARDVKAEEMREINDGR